ncbi:MAG TPA: iron-siderophore ABC transporter substrate-binding protein [Nocardioidaceae bacterium]|nr:iron-siderophore ABC transporter substrate-binding protein [Nocardioidaceae bacterium]
MARFRILAALGAAALTLTGCATGSTTEGSDTQIANTSADADAYPVTIEHAFGETTIEEQPKRVATLGWTDQDHVLALGVAPVGATKLTWGGNDAGSSDWFDAELERAGLEPPTRYDDADGAPVVEIAKLHPDLILATNSGITEKEYKKLSELAPVVAYPEAPWVTPWQTSLEMIGKALGRSDVAEKVADETQQVIDHAKAEYPQLEGKSLIFAYLTTADMSSIGIYGPEDPRVSFMHDLGLVDAPSVAKAVEPGEFYGTVSAERATELESDVLLTWSESPGDMKTFSQHSLIGQIPAIANGNAYAEADKHVSLAVTNPTPLSIPYIIDHFVPHVAEAAAGS